MLTIFLTQYSLTGILVTMMRLEMRRPHMMSRRECMPRYSRQLQTSRVQDLVTISDTGRMLNTQLTVL